MRQFNDGAFCNFHSWNEYVTIAVNRNWSNCKKARKNPNPNASRRFILTRGLKTKESFKLSAFQVVAVERKAFNQKGVHEKCTQFYGYMLPGGPLTSMWSLTRGIVIWLEPFGILENGSLRRVGRLWEVLTTVNWLETFWYFGKRVTQESWSLMRGFNYSELTGNFLVFWKTGHSGDLVAYERF